MDNLDIERTFVLDTNDPSNMGTVYPIVITKDNGDGTVQVMFDLNRMSPVKKVLVLTT